jgi:hypothetical protein
MRTFLCGFCAAGADDGGRVRHYASVMSDNVLPQAKHPKLIVVVALSEFIGNPR